MFDGRSRRTAVLLLVPAAVAGASLAGCSGSSGHSGNAALSAKAAAGAFSAAKLRGALLTRVNGVGAATPVASGELSSLPAAETGARSAGDVKATPKDCAQATQTGFNPGVLAASPAAAVTFKVDTNGVSEVLVSSPDGVSSTALAGKLPAACAHFRETTDGKTVTYTATASALTGIGKQARILNLQSSGGSADDLWSLVYRGKGFVGAVTVVGPNASQAAVRELAEQAYTYAAKSLS
ncbi:MAG: hypothetical protein ABSA02_05805 [Trebonia sp.]|jgi:hypothetical protein